MRDGPRIVLSTIHASDNYGSVLQASCLARALDRYGTVRVLDHRPAVLNVGYLQDSLPYQPLRRRFNPDVAAFARKHRRMLASQRVLLPLTPRVRGRVSGRHYEGIDVAVVGSDEVWSDLWGNQDQFFLAQAPETVRRIGYAVSVGRSEQFPEAGRHGAINRFDTVLVRDRRTAALCESAGRLADATVADPVLLANPAWLTEIAASHEDVRPTGPYTLIYLESCRGDDRIGAAISTADAPTQVVSVGFPSPGAVSRIDADTSEFVSLVAGAELVITNMFHGVLTSLALARPVAVLDHPSKRAKVTDLLDAVGADGTWSGSSSEISGERAGHAPLRLVTSCNRIEEFRTHSRVALASAFASVS